MLSEKEKIEIKMSKLKAEKDIMRAKYILRCDEIENKLEELQNDLDNIEIYQEFASGSFD